MTFNNLNPAFRALTLIAAAGTAASIVTFASFYQGLDAADPSKGGWLLSSVGLWTVLAAIAYSLTPRRSIFGFLCAAFASIVIGRINGLVGNTGALYFDLVAVFAMIAALLLLIWNDLKSDAKMLPESARMGGAEWVVTYVRLYIGYDFIAHFTEKWFAGPTPHNGLVEFFGVNLGLPNADMMVWVAGACEFGAAIGLVFGLFPRIGAIGAALYLFLSQYWGGHFPIGFIWALPGGGWEFGIFWMALILPFAVFGAGKLSLQNLLFTERNLPLAKF
jgi:putative oxidoreductase